MVHLALLTCRLIMGTAMFQQGEVLGLLALGCHWIMNTNLIGGVITGSLGKVENVLQVSMGFRSSQLCCAMNWGRSKLWLRSVA